MYCAAVALTGMTPRARARAGSLLQAVRCSHFILCGAMHKLALARPLLICSRLLFSLRREPPWRVVVCRCFPCCLPAFLSCTGVFPLLLVDPCHDHSWERAQRVRAPLFPAAEQFQTFNSRCHPLLPASSQVGRYAGYLAGIYSIMQFISAPIWGWVSDRVGRRPTVLFGLLGTLVSTLMFGFAEHFTFAIIARALWGLLNGNLGVGTADLR